MTKTTLCLIASAALAIAYGVVSPGWANAGVSHVALAALKASGIVLLAALAHTHSSRLLAGGLAFGALGDALLALSRETFIAGALAFLIGHLFYIALFLRAGIGVRVALAQPVRALGMAAMIAAAIASSLLLTPPISPLAAPLSVYTGILTLMVMASFTLPASRTLAMAGAVLFFVSDGFVALNMFHPNPDAAAAFWLSFAGWMIYWAGQAALCVGALGLHERSPATG